MAQKAAPKSARMAKLVQFLEGHPKPEFSEKVRRGDKRKFLKNRLKTSPRLKGLKALWRKCHYRLISMHLKCKDLKRLWRKKRLQRVPQWPSYCNFRRVTQNLHFLKKVQRGDQGTFFKNRPKSRLRLKGPKALWRKWHYPRTSMHLKCKDWRRFKRKQRLQKCKNGHVMAIFARSPKTLIF